MSSERPTSIPCVWIAKGCQEFKVNTHTQTTEHPDGHGEYSPAHAVEKIRASPPAQQLMVFRRHSVPGGVGMTMGGGGGGNLVVEVVVVVVVVVVSGK